MARYLGLGYPGGPAIDADRRRPGDPAAFAFPRAMHGRQLDFSFSGLKTSVVRTVERHPDAATADVAASFQEAVVDVLVAKARRAVVEIGAKGLCLAGGVAANSLLRRRVGRGRAPGSACRPTCRAWPCAPTTRPWSPPPGAWRLAHDGPSPLSLGADPNLFLPLTA